MLLSAAAAGWPPAATSLCGLQLPSVPRNSLRPLTGLSDAGVDQSPAKASLEAWMSGCQRLGYKFRYNPMGEQTWLMVPSVVPPNTRLCS